MTEKLFLSLDQGGSASRAMVFNSRGEVLCGEKVAVDTDRPRPQWIEQSPLDVVGSLRLAAEKVIDQLTPQQQSRLFSCAVVCQRSSLVCWDALSGETLSPVISWQDTRASQWLADLSLDASYIARVTGLQPNAHFGASKIRWCLDHNVAVAAASNAGRLRIAPLGSFLLYKLLEEKPYLVDPVNASRTLLMNLESLSWDKELLALFSVDQSILPRIVATESVFGTLKTKQLSLPVNLLSGDQSAAAFAYGEPADDSCYLNMGTGAFIYRNFPLQKSDDGLLNSVVHCRGGEHPTEYIREGTVNGAGSALQWFASQQNIDDITLALESAFAVFTARQDRPFFLNGIGGVGSPDWVADFPSKFIGEGGVAEKLIAIVDSIIFLIFRNFSLLSRDKKIQQVIVTGGLSNFDWICQGLADLLALPVARPEGCEASARGAVFLLSGRPDDWQVLDRKIFSPGDNQVIFQRYQQWQNLMLENL